MSTEVSSTLVRQFMQNFNNKNKGSKKVKEAGCRTPIDTVGTANERATGMPSTANAEGSAMTMSGTSNNNEVGGVPISTARATTEKAII